MLAVAAFALAAPAATVVGLAARLDRRRKGARQRRRQEAGARARPTSPACRSACRPSVELRIGNSEGITIETDDNLLPLIETVIENGTLKIRPVKRNMNLQATHA